MGVEKDTNIKDGSITVSEVYSKSSKGLSVISSSALIVADVVGTGVLALPNDLRIVLGNVWGIMFVLLNLPINLYAGYLLNESARLIEEQQYRKNMQSVKVDTIFDNSPLHKNESVNIMNNDDLIKDVSASEETEKDDVNLFVNEYELTEANSSYETCDLIGIAGTLFGMKSKTRKIVLVMYYVNLFLVLGNYILVMAHSVRAVIGEESICTPTAGIIASLLMLAFSQLDTMTKLGRSVTVLSILSLIIVVILCLLEPKEYYQPENEYSLLRKMAALSSIGFAIGSQKLFLNIRHEMREPNKSPISLASALAIFGSFYIIVSQLAGPYPQPFLFDSIPKATIARRVAGFFLWLHVAVSYAINSQALCSSIDRLALYKITFLNIKLHPKVRWFILTLTTSVLAFLVANAIPFFQDLISLIGALTTIPLSLSFPAIFYRKALFSSWLSYFLLLFSLLFTFCGLLGAFTSIDIDWKNHGPPFSCNS